MFWGKHGIYFESTNEVLERIEDYSCYHYKKTYHSKLHIFLLNFF